MFAQVLLSLGCIVLLFVPVIMGQRHPRAESTAGSPADVSLIETLQCPVCDYGISFAVRQTALQEALCRSYHLSEFRDNASGLEAVQKKYSCENSKRRDATGAMTQRLSVSPDYALELLLELCGEAIVDVFPAVETVYATGSTPQRAEAYRTMRNANAADKRYYRLIQSACTRSVDKRRNLRTVAAKLTDAARHVAFAGRSQQNIDVSSQFEVDLEAGGNNGIYGLIREHHEARGSSGPVLTHEEYLRLLSLDTRRAIFQAVVASQEDLCNSVCPQGIKRQQVLGMPRALGYNAFGNRVLAHEHLNFEEMEALRKQ